MPEGRWLHPGAWWAWALGLAAAASRTTNPLLLGLLILAAAVVVHARRPEAPWGRSFGFFLRLGVFVIVVRVVIQVLFGSSIGTTELVHLPGIALPSWLAGVRLGGDLTLESLLLAFYDGLRLATILICVGAANSLASPTRLLKSIPAALYELGVSVVVALTFTPLLVADVDRLRTARRLRGRSASGPRAIAGSAVPVLEGALERSVMLAAAMDSRGYGRRGDISQAQRRVASFALLGGLAAACVGAFGLVSVGSPAVLGLPMLVLGVLATCYGVVIAGRRNVRSNYRPDPWRLAEWLVLLAGVGTAAVFSAAAWAGVAGLDAVVDPPTWPTLPLITLIGIALAVSPALTAPPLPESAVPVRRTDRSRHPRRGGRMIIFDHVTITYPGAAGPILRDVSLTIPEGELVLVVGRTGTGKSTFLRAINGLVPHFTGGHMSGRVIVDGRDTATHPPRELADLVGVVPQDPMSGFVTDTVEDELAYGMECLGLGAGVMRRRVEETLDLLGLADLRQRPLRSLSGGQRQRVAIGAVLTSHPRILVLDEPTSALDPGAAEEVLAALQRLVHDLGVTVIMAEHRLERVVQYADQIVIVPGEGQPLLQGSPPELMRSAPIAPPVVELGRLAGWQPLPLSVRDARRAAGPLRDLLVGRTPHLRAVPESTVPLAHTRQLVVRYGTTTALAGVSLELSAGEILAIMGRNGAGKSTLLHALVGIGPAVSGAVQVNGSDPRALGGAALLDSVGLVPQEPGDLLQYTSVSEECRASDRDAGCDPGTTRALLALMAPEIEDGSHPRDLSEGQRLLVVLCLILAARPPVLLLDEPTRGLDYPTKARLARVLSDLADAGHAVVLATHDVELVAEVADRVVILADGEIVADGPTTEVVTSSPMFAPQVAKILSPQAWLTVDQVAAAIRPTIEETA